MSPSASLDNLQLFIAVAEAGGFSRASERLDLPVATLSRRIAQLEKELNVPLFKRNTRNVSLTPAGESFYAQLMPALESVHSAINDLSDAAASLQGLIRLTSAADFVQHCLALPLTQFLQRNPDVKLDLNLNSQRMDLVTEQIDLAIRIGTLEDSNLFAWHLFDMPLKLFATPSYLAGIQTLNHPHDLANCNFIRLRTNKNRTEWVLKNGDEQITHHVQGNITVNDMGVVIAMCEASAGIGIIPEAFVQTQLNNHTLVPVLPNWHSLPSKVHAITTARNPPARVKHLIEFLKQALQQFNRS